MLETLPRTLHRNQSYFRTDHSKQKKRARSRDAATSKNQDCSTPYNELSEDALMDHMVYNSVRHGAAMLLFIFIRKSSMESPAQMSTPKALFTPVTIPK